ncbi:hypothetical protein MCOR08_011846, partial [Pyricularia oryzae]
MSLVRAKQKEKIAPTSPTKSAPAFDGSSAGIPFPGLCQFSFASDARPCQAGRPFSPLPSLLLDSPNSLPLHD